MNAARSRPDWLATVQSGRKQAQSRVCTPGFSVTPFHLQLIITCPLLLNKRIRLTALALHIFCFVVIDILPFFKTRDTLFYFPFRRAPENVTNFTHHLCYSIQPRMLISRSSIANTVILFTFLIIIDSSIAPGTTNVLQSVQENRNVSNGRHTGIFFLLRLIDDCSTHQTAGREASCLLQC